MDTNRLCPSCQKPLAPDVPMGLCPECLINAGFPTGLETDTGSAKQPAFVPPTVGEIARLFPQLEILELVGKGGMGAVYKARQKQLNRFVALKILPPGIGSEPAFAERFTREAQALARLNHPGIVTLYEFGETSGQFYFLMEYVDGVNLRQLLAERRISAREALAIVPQICDALQFAHDQGIVHRDIKPENILLDRRGRVKVADFGLAKLAGTESFGVPPSGGPDRPNPECQASLTDAGKIMGTPKYMAPEQVEHPGEVDNRADIYALGVVFYQMLTGELPGKRIELPSSKVRIDVRLDEIVLRALEKKPELRYQQVSEVKTMVETIAQTLAAEPEAIVPEPANLPGQPSIIKQKRTMQITNNRTWWIVSAGAVVCIALAVGLVTFLTRFGHHQLTVKAFIDSSDVVKVSGSRLWFEHESGALPGRNIFVNGKAWSPSWTNNVSTEFVGLNPVFRSRDPQKLQITKRIGRGTVSIAQFPSPANDETLAVRLDDAEFGGADWYEVAISW
jgi:serine/threonine protein kinase